MAPIRVGIVGFGFATNCFHLPFILLNKDLEVYAFLQRAAQTDPQKSWGHCKDKFPEARHYQTADAFFADPNIDVVVVAAHKHDEFVEQALYAGKHVVVEKPFTSTSYKADELIALAKKKGKILTVFQNRRLDSDFRTVAHLVKEGAFGDIREAEIHYDFPNAPWVSNWPETGYEPGRGMLFDLGTHNIDQALALFGRPASITAFLRSNRDGGTESDVHDTFTVVLQYAGEKKNLLVTIKTSIVSVMTGQLRFYVRGTKGTYLKFGNDPQEDKTIAAPGQPAADPHFGDEDPSIWGTLTTKDKPFDPEVQSLDQATGYYTGKYPSLPGLYRAYYENLAAAVHGKEDLLVNPEVSRDGIRIIELARKSHINGATVPWSDGE